MKDWLGNFEIVRLYRTLGPVRFIATFLSVLAIILSFVALQVWLEGITGWPEAYGFHCHGKCMIQNLWHSPALLHRATLSELGLFALIWFMPVLLLAVLIYALLKKRAQRIIFKSDLSE